VSKDRIRILDFDLENRPLAYIGQDYTTSEITAIAACFDGEPRSMRVWLLGRDEPVKMLEGFRKMYDAADMVTGHYIRMHDLPKINGSMVEHGLAPLDEKLTCDTKLDLVAHGGEISASQENLATMLGLDKLNPKVHMSNAMWREANRLGKAGQQLTEARAKGDIIQHMALRKALVARGLLSSPKVWRP
jgi:hypothetical protein